MSKILEKKITRRTFLKGSAATAAGVAAAGALGDSLFEGSLFKVVEGATPGDEVKVIPTWCQMCGTHQFNCAVLCTVKNGRWVGVQGNPEAGNNWGRGSTTVCAKANAAPQTIYAPNRIKYPMKRVGAKGENKFQRITWDEALDTIATKMTEYKEKYGPECYANLSPEFWPVLDGGVGSRFLHVYGSPNYLHSAICAVQEMESCKISSGVVIRLSPPDPEKTKLHVNWGSNPENSGANQGRPWFIIEGQSRGMKYIDIRPMMDPLAAKADVWVPIRPGTDCALALAILNVIIGEKLYDFDFVSQWCYGFEELAEHVKQFPPEWAAPITGISAERITEIARMMGTIKPMNVAIGNGVGDQQNDGNWAVVCINLIAAITGNLGIAGGPGVARPTGPALIKLSPTSTLVDRLPRTEEDIANGWAAGMSKLVAPEFPRWYYGATKKEPTSAYFKALMSILTEKPYPIRILNASRSNPLSATRQPKKIVEALKKLDFMFAMDIWWGPHLAYADIVLPCASGYEQSCQVSIKNMPEGTWIGCTNVVVPPPGECRSDHQFYLDLAVAMGYGADFWNGDMDACLREQLAPSGISLEELRAAPKGIFVPRTGPIPEPKYKDYATLFASLPHGKVQCYNEFIGGKPNADGTGTLPYLPVYKGPPEGIAQTPELAKEYPLIISDVHAYRLCQHSFHHNVPYLREKQPYPWVKINPATAKKYGIGDGDWMKIESPHGYIVMKAEYFEGIAPEVLMTKRGWWQECVELNLPGYDAFDGGSEVNILYNSDIELFDEFHSGMAKQTLVKISKADGPPEIYKGIGTVQ